MNMQTQKFRGKDRSTVTMRRARIDRVGLFAWIGCVLLCAPLSTSVSLAPSRSSVDIYFIDVEGGQSTLIATPAGEALLVDAGFPSTGTFASVPGAPSAARDATRIAAAAKDAGVSQIDYLVTTHFHADHDGGVPELAQLLPIRTFVDHGTVAAKAEENVPGTLKAFEAYASARAKGKHLEPAPGDRIALKGVDVTIVSTRGKTVSRPLGGGGAPTSGCPATSPPAQEPNENPNSTGFRLQFGKFAFLDVGDLSGAPLYALACPVSMVGPIAVYLVAHHGGVDAAQPFTFNAFRPRVAVVNNGRVKGGAPELLAMTGQFPAVDIWQLHRSAASGAQNTADERIANLDESTAHWIKVSARQDGSFTVTNGRTGVTKSYEK